MSDPCFLCELLKVEPKAGYCRAHDPRWGTAAVAEERMRIMLKRAKEILRGLGLPRSARR